jgi:hypothetical protein
MTVSHYATGTERVLSQEDEMGESQGWKAEERLRDRVT